MQLNPQVQWGFWIKAVAEGFRRAKIVQVKASGHRFVKDTQYWNQSVHGINLLKGGNIGHTNYNQFGSA